MNADIWAKCRPELNPLSLIGEVYRVVESQKQVATNQLVDGLAEQALLEEMLDQSKPKLPQQARQLHYLLSTPFRYPPLRHGSRFGRRFEPSLFYGSRSLTTALAETAYYRLRFWHDMAEPPPAAKLHSQHTAFTANIHTDKGLQLQHRPCKSFHQAIRNPRSHQDTQALGTHMREYGIQAFEFPSARDTAGGINAALFYPQVLQSKHPESVIQLLCSTSQSGVEFIDEQQIVYTHRREDFLVQGQFPVFN